MLFGFLKVAQFVHQPRIIELFLLDIFLVGSACPVPHLDLYGQLMLHIAIQEFFIAREANQAATLLRRVVFGERTRFTQTLSAVYCSAKLAIYY